MSSKIIVNRNTQKKIQTPETLSKPDTEENEKPAPKRSPFEVTRAEVLQLLPDARLWYEAPAHNDVKWKLVRRITYNPNNPNLRTVLLLEIHIPQERYKHTISPSRF